MKFTLKQVKTGCRIGLIESTQGSTCGEETPMCMLYTRAGCVPNLTKDMLDRIERLPKVVQMPLPLLVEHHQTLDTFGQGIKKFTGWKDSLVYLSIQDPAVATPSGYNDKMGVSMWSRGGRVKMDVSLYEKVLKAFQPDACQILADTDTDKQSTSKRLKKSHDRTMAFTTQVMEIQKESEKLSACRLVGTLTGGWDKTARLRSLRELLKLDLQGLAFEGFHNFGPDTECLRVTEVQDIMEELNVELDKHPTVLRIWHGIMDPYNVLCAVEQGIDVFDSSFPAVVSARGAALVFPYDITHTAPSDPVAEICLTDKKYVEDLSPVLEGCTCYTCQHHTKAYVCHLLNTTELLAGVLLSVHNFHHYLRFFEKLRQSLDEDNYSEFRKLICSAYTDKS